MHHRRRIAWDAEQHGASVAPIDQGESYAHWIREVDKSCSNKPTPACLRLAGRAADYLGWGAMAGVCVLPLANPSRSGQNRST
jgi:hypothetical protein